MTKYRKKPNDPEDWPYDSSLDLVVELFMRRKEGE